MRRGCRNGSRPLGPSCLEAGHEDVASPSVEARHQRDSRRDGGEDQDRDSGARAAEQNRDTGKWKRVRCSLEVLVHREEHQGHGKHDHPEAHDMHRQINRSALGHEHLTGTRRSGES